jgi:hypothetical protein
MRVATTAGRPNRKSAYTAFGSEEALGKFSFNNSVAIREAEAADKNGSDALTGTS